MPPGTQDISATGSDRQRARPTRQQRAIDGWMSLVQKKLIWIFAPFRFCSNEGSALESPAIHLGGLPQLT
jgi:hypothetical protein